VKLIALAESIQVNDLLEFEVDMQVPFSVRRIDISFICKDANASSEPIVLRIHGVTDGNMLATCYNQYSKVHSIFFDPPRQFQGTHKIEVLSPDPATQQLDLHEASYDCSFVVNIACHNQV